MANTNRYKGLVYLKEQGLPVPNFLKIEQLCDIREYLSNQIAQYGWTIRTCKKDGINEFNLFYKNNITFDELKIVVSNRFAQCSDEFYVIYHSWDFDFSFNIIKSYNEYIIEGKTGSQKSISLGVSNPTFSIKICVTNLRIKQSFFEIPSLKIKHGIFRALRLLNNSVYHSNYYTEVAITKQKQIYFYEFTNISEM
ncbi:MAG: hypothetical protein KAQ75_01980 [Bacteroidales bacterium]|nr:hypothetical protein [Bacteroidales bacterium]